jgi:hypothetical protein
VRVKGQWYIGLLRETPQGTAVQELGWLVGTWTCKTDNAEIRMVFDWVEGNSFIRGRVTTKSVGSTSTAFQVIGVDPATGALKSWTFEDDGGVGEAIWTRTEKGWTAKVTGYSADGEKTTAITTLTPASAESFAWQSTDRVSDGEKAPDIGPIKVTRDKTARDTNPGPTPVSTNRSKP